MTKIYYVHRKSSKFQHKFLWKIYEIFKDCDVYNIDRHTAGSYAGEIACIMLLQIPKELITESFEN